MRLRFARGLRAGQVLAVAQPLLGDRPKVDHLLFGVLALKHLQVAGLLKRLIEYCRRHANAVVLQQRCSRLRGHGRSARSIRGIIDRVARQEIGIEPIALGDLGQHQHFAGRRRLEQSIEALEDGQFADDL
ncbi:hypothetical protein D9M73_230600 [compost metagenome]